ncbi:MAG: hypothetical protein LBK82_17615 [Planctomycetaceae bacterium]|nr:hypothetical protein [Planctomycetaceae bacterium]
MPIRFALPLQGDCWAGTVTHRVAVGCYALPLQGGGKLAILLSCLVLFLLLKRDIMTIS